MKIITFIIFSLIVTTLLHAHGKGHDDHPDMTDLDEIADSFQNLEFMVGKLSEKSVLTLYEGIPRPGKGKKIIEDKEFQKTINDRLGYKFTNQPSEINKEDVAKLISLIKKEGTFEKFSGHKRCGGFHPDFCLFWQDGGSIVEFHICFGCHEMIIYSGVQWVYCDISKAGYDSFKDILSKHQLLLLKPEPTKELR